MELAALIKRQRLRQPNCHLGIAIRPLEDSISHPPSPKDTTHHPPPLTWLFTSYLLPSAPILSLSFRRFGQLKKLLLVKINFAFFYIPK